jgi:endonuclease/exonuclease/phosphatase family metal-dependent hydrolase
MRVIDLPRAREPRKAMVVTITLAGQALFIANTHLENRVSLLHGLMFVAGARGRQAEAIVAALPPGPGIAGGDLNTWLGMGEPA